MIRDVGFRGGVTEFALLAPATEHTPEDGAHPSDPPASVLALSTICDLLNAAIDLDPRTLQPFRVMMGLHDAPRLLAHHMRLGCAQTGQRLSFLLTGIFGAAARSPASDVSQAFLQEMLDNNVTIMYLHVALNGLANLRRCPTTAPALQQEIDIWQEVLGYGIRSLGKLVAAGVRAEVVARGELLQLLDPHNLRPMLEAFAEAEQDEGGWKEVLAKKKNKNKKKKKKKKKQNKNKEVNKPEEGGDESPAVVVAVVEQGVGGAPQQGVAGTSAGGSDSATATATADDRQCRQCGGRHEQLQVCSGCMGAKYCSADCQGAHWRAHRKECKRVRERQAEAEGDAP
jgi:hypothetical protein